MKGAIVFLAAFLLFLLISLGYAGLPPGRQIYDAVVGTDTDYEVSGITVTTLAIAKLGNDSAKLQETFARIVLVILGKVKRNVSTLQWHCNVTLFMKFPFILHHLQSLARFVSLLTNTCKHTKKFSKFLRIDKS